MNIPVDGLLYIFLSIIGVLRFVGGLFIMYKSKHILIGFLSVCIVSLISLTFLLEWFQSAVVDVDMGNIPWLFNQAFDIVLYILFLVIPFVVLKRIHKKRKLK